MRRTTFLPAATLGLLAALVMAAPAGAASTGTICGEVTAFTAPTASADGSLTIDGAAEVIDNSAAAAIDAATRARLAALANADATTCLEVEANASGAIVDIALAAQARICGTVTADVGANAFSVDGVVLAASALSGDAEATAVLEAAADAGANACVDVGLDTTSGLIASVGVDASFEVCGAVTLDASGDATVDGTDIDAALLRGDAAALLQLAASADGTACATVSAVSDGTRTSVGVDIDVEVCAEVTALTDDTITLNGVTLILGGAAAGDIQVGDVVCVTAGTGPTGDGVITVPDEVLGEGVTLLPNTAAAADASAAWLTLAGLGLIGSGAGLIALGRRGRIDR
jgi:hypothetical protein